ncbi:MAG: DUF1146 domain-containing protein [Mollicutes bacterium]|nr:DUF1146 domain-containing protein [Mollicutes bacterium]
MNYKIYIYFLVLIVTIFSLTGINFNGFFKKNHIIEAKIFVMLIAFAISFLVSEFIIKIIELT